MIRSTVAGLTATVLAGLGVVSTADVAHAEGSCTFSPPARISITTDHTTLPANFSGDCVPRGFAYWFTDQPTDHARAVFFPNLGAEIPVIQVPDVLGSYGAQRWVGAGAADNEVCNLLGTTMDSCDLLDQNEAYSDIRLGVAPWLTGTRRGSQVTLTVTSNIWSTGADHFFARAMGGELQIQNADGSWSRFGTPFSTYPSGRRTVVANVVGHRNFRYAVYSTAYSWNKVSSAVAP